jgi:Zn-dependent protease with chaperone function
MRSSVLAAMTFGVLWMPVSGTAGGQPRHPRDPVSRALAFFEASQGDGEAFLRQLRPAPVSAAVRAAIVAALPHEGELEPTDRERAKIATLDAVFEFHERKGSIVVKVIDVGHAFVGLHARTVLLLSRDALSLVRPEELQALAAHELGHEFFWDEYQAARRDDPVHLQELELRCDGVAVTTLRALGRGPEALVRAITKLTRYNERLDATASAASYVSLKDRKAFIEAITRRSSSRARQTNSGPRSTAPRAVRPTA